MTVPSDFLHMDTGFPAFTGQESTEDKLATMQNYLYMLLEQLRYTLFNLDPAVNMNAAALGTLTNSITEPVYAKISDAEGNIATLALTAQGLATRVTDAEGNISELGATAQGLGVQISDMGGNVSALALTAQGLGTRVSNVEGDISTLNQTSQGLSSRVSNAEGSISTLQQTATGLSSRVSNAEGSISSLQQTATGLSSRITSAEGNITTAQQTANGAVITAQNAAGQAQQVALTVNGFTVTNGQGQTTINGNKIQSGTITGTSLISSGPYTEMITIQDGCITIGQSAFGGTFKYDGEKVYLNANLSPLKLGSLLNVSIDAGAGRTVFIGTSNQGQTISIGTETGRINLIGDVYVNGVRLQP